MLEENKDIEDQAAHASDPEGVNDKRTQKNESYSFAWQAGLITIWFVVSTSIIIFNKLILSTRQFPYPVFLTTTHMLFATLATRIMRYAGYMEGIEEIQMTRELWLKGILPIGVLFSFGLVCGNKAYITLSISFTQMLKALMPVIVLFFSWIFGQQKITPKLLLVVSVVVLGIVIASFGEIRFEFFGFIYQASALISESLRLVLVQRLLKGINMSPMVSLYYLAPVCAAVNLIFLLPLEGTKPFEEFEAKIGFGLLSANVLLAFCLNVLIMNVIKSTSSFVLALCGILKDIVLVGLSVLIFGSEVTPMQLVGYSITLAALHYHKSAKY